MVDFSNELIGWLNDILETYVCEDLSISNVHSDHLILTFNHTDAKIHLPLIEELWRLNTKSPLVQNYDFKIALGQIDVEEELISFNDESKTLYINYDILGLAFWMLCRIEEINPLDSFLDKHTRFPATQSLAFKNNFLDRPIVDEWFYFLRIEIEKYFPEVSLKKHRFSTKPSHDVDEPSRYGFKSFKKLIRIMAGDLLKRKDVIGFFKAPFVKLSNLNRLSPIDKMNSFDWIMSLSEKHNLKSAFYFICGRTDETKDADYEIEHPAIVSLLKKINKRGHEIGLHPSYATYLDTNAINDEKERLLKTCQDNKISLGDVGCRMHYLRYAFPDTLYYLDENGFSYDTTLGFADLPGFRCGTCREYPAYDPIKEKQLSIKIRPLIAMECTIVSDQYMGLGATQEALNEFIKLKDACRTVNGCFTILWHNSQLWRKDMRALYQKVIEH